MDTFILFLTLGFTHVLDINGLDHFYFITALVLPFRFLDKNKLLLWVSLFTLGHTLSLVGNYYLGLQFSSFWIELLIPVTIAISCIPLLQSKTPEATWVMTLTTMGYGLIHGLGFGRYFAMMVPPEGASLSLLSFALGVEVAQLLIVLGVLSIAFLFSKTQYLKVFRQITGVVIFIIALSMIVERIGLF